MVHTFKNQVSSADGIAESSTTGCAEHRKVQDSKTRNSAISQLRHCRFVNTLRQASRVRNQGFGNNNDI